MIPLPLDDIVVAESTEQEESDILVSPKPQHDISVYTVSSSSESRRNTPENLSQGSSTAHSAPLAAKRFSAVNINKKFLEKTSSSGSSFLTHSIQINGASKMGNSATAYTHAAGECHVHISIFHVPINCSSPTWCSKRIYSPKTCDHEINSFHTSGSTSSWLVTTKLSCANAVP